MFFWCVKGQEGRDRYPIKEVEYDRDEAEHVFGRTVGWAFDVEREMLHALISPTRLSMNVARAWHSRFKTTKAGDAGTQKSISMSWHTKKRIMTMSTMGRREHNARRKRKPY